MRAKKTATTVEENITTAVSERELSATQEHLQTMVEELETFNKELQSTNEELLTVNEELQVKSSELAASLAAQGANSGIWNWNIATGEMHWSEWFCRMLGIRPKSFKPSIDTFKERIHDDDRSEVVDILNAHLARRLEFNTEFRMRREDKNYLWLHTRGQAIWNDRKEPVRMTGTVYDITDHRQTLENLSRTNESLGRFAYVCSHDLKEPVRIIENFVNLFQSQYSDILDDKGKAYLGFIEDNTARIQEMIKGILTYSQLESKDLSLESIDVKHELDTVRKNLRLAITESSAQVTNGPLPNIKADRLQIIQILQNLIGNALKFCRERQPVIHISADESSDEYTFSVADNGIGMKPENTHKIFNMFQRLNRKEEYPGSGIGLSICQRIVSKHGGRIWAESEEGKGSTFYFTLPRKNSGS